LQFKPDSIITSPQYRPIY